MNYTDLGEEEAALVDAFRRASAKRDGPLPAMSEAQFVDRMRVDLGLGGATIRQTVRRLGLTVERYDGPRVILNDSLATLRASWKAHHDDLVRRGASGPVIRHRREAVARWCKCAGVDWSPERSVYEKRSTAARGARSATIELPEDFVDLARALVVDVCYHKDVAVNAMYQHRARLNFMTAPRCPSEDARLQVSDVSLSRGVVTYRQTKIAGPEGEVVTVPREVFGLGANVLSWPARKSAAVWMDHWRPKLLNRALLRAGEDCGAMWLGPRGARMDPEKYRLVFGAMGKTVWPGFYPYLVREVGIIMRALQIIQERGHLDLELLIQWTGHEKLDTMRRYTRKARQLLREAGGKPDDLGVLLADWRAL